MADLVEEELRLLGAEHFGECFAYLELAPGVPYGVIGRLLRLAIEQKSLT